MKMYPNVHYETNKKYEIFSCEILFLRKITKIRKFTNFNLLYIYAFLYLTTFNNLVDIIDIIVFISRQLCLKCIKIYIFYEKTNYS